MILKNNRSRLLRNLQIGDIFHATSDSAPILICLVTMVEGMYIYSRVLTTQQVLIFNIDTGLRYDLRYENTLEEGNDCVINSVEPLPIEIHNTIIHFDRKCRLESGKENQPVTKDEKNALMFVDEHYASNPLPLK